ncbi:hypothetical protein OG407_16435 [Streptomyces sp. NBC_01515]|uniref:hypothetical protein n=1 Tax=Streptomyces sp. NBC_01515 TaxID=2903890 RepID=UPI003865B9F5
MGGRAVGGWSRSSPRPFIAALFFSPALYRLRPSSTARRLSSTTPFHLRPSSTARRLSSTTPFHLRPSSTARRLSSTTPFHLRPLATTRRLSPARQLFSAAMAFSHREPSRRCRTALVPPVQGARA